MTLLDMAQLYGISSCVERISDDTIRINFRYHTVPLQFQQTVAIDTLVHTPNLEDKICNSIYQEMLPYIRGYDPEYMF